MKDIRVPARLKSLWTKASLPAAVLVLLILVFVLNRLAGLLGRVLKKG